jgi:hypothetical protein
MMTVPGHDNLTLFPIPENRLVFRNEIPLPKSPESCIVVYERGLRLCPEVPLFTGTTFAKCLMPPAKLLRRANL